MQYIIFGAGNNAEGLIQWLAANEFTIKYLVDNDVNKQGKSISGFEIKSPDVLKNPYKEQHILISVSNKVVYGEIAEQLTNMGYMENKDFSNGLRLSKLSEPLSGKVSGYIKIPDVFSSVKSFDPASRLVKLKKKRRIFRLVNENYIEQYLEVYRICNENHLFDDYVIETCIVENTWKLPVKLIFEHRFLAPISYSFEWSPAMFYDYVDFMLRMITRFAECGLAFADGHALNATIANGKFVFIDFGAMKPGVTSESVLLEFINTHIIPLILMYRNQIPKAYLYLKNPGIEYTVTDIQGYLDAKELSEMHALHRCLMQINTAQDICRFIKRLSDFIEGLKKYELKTRWNGYQNDEWEWSPDPDKWSQKMHNVTEMMEGIYPETVVDLAGNMGWYGSYRHEKLKYAVIMDYDYNCLDYLWQKIQTLKIENVLPAYMSVCAPTLDYYRDDAISSLAIEPWRKSAIERFKAELVIALAIVHHLAFAQQLTFSEIVGQFALFSSKYLIVEFIEQSDQYITDFLKEGFEWYTKENFVRELEKRFRILESRPSTPHETRTLYLCELEDTNAE
jgi:hypothetical protein